MCGSGRAAPLCAPLTWHAWVAQEVHSRIVQLQARTADVEAQAERRAASARKHKQARVMVAAFYVMCR